MNCVTAIFLGLIEGITEFLPVSSTGHLILATNILRIPQTDFLKSFEIAIQLGAILSVLVLYWKSLLADYKILTKVIIAFIPTAIIGFVFYKIIKKVLLGNSQVVIWSLLLGGIFLIIFEFVYKEKENSIDNLQEISYANAFLIGVFQSIAVIPGVSRAAATIVGGLFLGIKRKTIVVFSFLLAMPTIFAATTFDLLKSSSTFKSGEFIFLSVGFFASFIVALFAIKFLVYFIKDHSFISFGIYRIVVAIFFWFIV